MKSLSAMFMRGGTSKAVMILKKDLPDDISQWDQIFLDIMGSPDGFGRQLNGMGGGISSVSKIAVLDKSERSDADIDYTFVQVGIDKPIVDYKGNCGNISSAVGPFALESGLLNLPDGEHQVRIYNTNTQKIIISKFKVTHGKPEYNGDISISGVSGHGVDVELSFLNPAGATTGTIYPGGHKVYAFTLEDFENTVASLVIEERSAKNLRQRFIHSESVEVWSLDVANACFFIQAKDLGLVGSELPEELNRNKELLLYVDIVRSWVSVKMGISKTVKEAQGISTVPYGVIYGVPSQYTTTDGEKIWPEDYDLLCRAIAGKKVHQTLPLTVSLCAAAFTALHRPKDLTITHLRTRLGTPAGVLELGMDVDFKLLNKDPMAALQKGMFYRTARLLMQGQVFYS